MPFSGKNGSSQQNLIKQHEFSIFVAKIDQLLNLMSFSSFRNHPTDGTVAWKDLDPRPTISKYIIDPILIYLHYNKSYP